MIDQKFGRWLVLERALNTVSRDVKYLCRCDCGNESIVFAKYLRNGKSTQCRSCGTSYIKDSSPYGKCHKLYKAANAVFTRCSHDPYYIDYELDFTSRVELTEYLEEVWLDQFGHTDYYMYGLQGYTVDRIDNERGYFKGNIKFSTMKEQANNRRNSRNG